MANEREMEPAVAETHISTVVMLGERAYKLKKPVQFDFVDQSTVEARRLLCEREVTRNRRLAPDVYEGVATVLGPDGAVCDHLVVMRRMPSNRRLSTLAATRDPSLIGGIGALARSVAEFHGRAERSPDIERAGRALDAAGALAGQRRGAAPPGLERAGAGAGREHARSGGGVHGRVHGPLRLPAAGGVDL